MQCFVTEHHISGNRRKHYNQSATTSDWKTPCRAAWLSLTASLSLSRTFVAQRQLSSSISGNVSQTQSNGSKLQCVLCGTSQIRLNPLRQTMHTSRMEALARSIISFGLKPDCWNGLPNFGLRLRWFWLKRVTPWQRAFTACACRCP